MTQKGNAKAAYEGILVISQQPTTVISETTRNIINQVINQNTRVVIDGDDGNDGDDGCPPGTTGIPPNCEPNCDVDDSPEECVPTEFPDGRIMPPGEPCPDDALLCDVPDPPEGCSVPTECPDGSIIPPGEQCPEEEPPGAIS